MTTTPVQLLDHRGDPIAMPQRTRPAAMNKSYHNSTRDRTRQGTRGPLGSVNAHHDRRTLDDLIRDCGALVRNSILTQSIVDSSVLCVVGPEVIADPRSGDKEWDRDVQRRFADWAAVCDITGQQNLTGLAADVVGSWYDAGGVLAHKVMHNGRYPRIEMVEAIRLMNEAGRPDTRDMVGGVELNPDTMRPVRYWIADWNEQGTALDYNPQPHDATHLWIINNPRLRQAGQYRTAPRLAAHIDKLEALETACKATMGAYQLATYVALAITQSLPEGVNVEEQLAQYMVDNDLATSTDDAKERGVWGPGTVMNLLPGEGVSTIDPAHPTTAWDAYIWTELQQVCGSLGLPLELVFMRFIRNWSASKSAISVAWQSVRRDQGALKQQFLVPAYRWWLANEMREGRIDEPESGDWRAVEFLLPQQPVLDPKLEAEAHLLALAGGIKRHSRVLQEMGEGDRDEFMRDFKYEAQTNEEAGLTYAQPTVENVSKTVNTDEEQGADA